MIVKLDSKKYSITWRHLQDQNGIAGLTYCIISELGEERGMRKQIVQGMSRCSLKDHYCKNSGRKLSLQRALLTRVPPEGAIERKDGWHPVFEKEQRQLVWSEYFRMRGGKF